MSNGKSQDGMMSMPEFASALRTRFPMYEKESDLDLVNAFLKMYPQYRGTVNLAETPGSPRPTITPQPMAESTPRKMAAYQTAIRPLEVAEQNVRGLASPAITALSLPVKAQAAAVQGPQALKDFLSQQGSEAAEVLNPATALQAINPKNLIDVEGFKMGVPQGMAGTATNLATGYGIGKFLGSGASPYKLSPKVRTNKLSYAVGAGGADFDVPEALRGSQKDLDIGMAGQLRTTKGVSAGADASLKRLNTEFGTALQPLRGQSVMPTFIVSRILSRVNPYMLNTPEGTATYTALTDAAARYMKPWSWGSLDYERTQAEGRMSSYYKLERAGQANTIKLKADAMIDKAIIDGTREGLYNRLDQTMGKPPGYYDALKKTQGRLINIRDQAKAHAVELSNITAEAKGGPRWTPEQLELRAHSTGRLIPGGVIGTVRKGLFGPPDYEARASKAVEKAYKPRTVLQKSRPYAAGAAAVSAARRKQEEEEEPPQ